MIDAKYDEERYAARFYDVVEVLSSTDLARNPRTGRTAIDDKLAFYARTRRPSSSSSRGRTS